MKKLFTENGARLYRTIRIKIYSPGNAKFDKRIIQAPPRKGYTEEQIQKVLEEYVEKLTTAMPGHEYRLVEVGEATFNFVWESYTPPKASTASDDSQPPAQEASVSA